MTTFTIEITDSQFRALEYVAVDPAHWAREFVLHRSITATNEIVALVTEHCLDNGLTLPGTREAMIIFAYDNNLIQTAANQNSSPE